LTVYCFKNKCYQRLTKNYQLKMSDVNIKITDREGVTHDVVAPTDMSMNLMEIIRSYELAEEGTIGVCGGMAMCASCQVYVISDPGLEEMGAEEDAMLGEAFHVQENSRLGCQLHIVPEMEGLEVEIAPYP
jgi:2Fe-2S ferredoxin